MIMFDFDFFYVLSYILCMFKFFEEGRVDIVLVFVYYFEGIVCNVFWMCVKFFYYGNKVFSVGVCG